MAKKNKSKKSKKVKQIREEEEEVDEVVMSDPETDVGNTLTLDEIDAISDEDGDEVAEWNAEAQALRQAIAEGAFDKLKTLTPFENDNDGGHEDAEEEEDDAENEDGGEGDSGEEQQQDEEVEDAEQEDEEAETEEAATKQDTKALRSVTSELLYDKATLPWQEKMDNIPSMPLPFGQMTEDGLVIDVHDDLKREVAFYNLALESVYGMRSKCENGNVPFSRPVDFFAEMVKTDGK